MIAEVERAINKVKGEKGADGITIGMIKVQKEFRADKVTETCNNIYEL